MTKKKYLQEDHYHKSHLAHSKKFILINMMLDPKSLDFHNMHLQRFLFLFSPSSSIPSNFEDIQILLKWVDTSPLRILDFYQQIPVQKEPVTTSYFPHLRKWQEWTNIRLIFLYFQLKITPQILCSFFLMWTTLFIFRTQKKKKSLCIPSTYYIPT